MRVNVLFGVIFAQFKHFIICIDFQLTIAKGYFIITSRIPNTSRLAVRRIIGYDTDQTAVLFRLTPPAKKRMEGVMMEQNNLIRDFAGVDLTISSILAADYITTSNWARPTAYPRPSNGLILLTEGSIRYFFKDGAVTAHAGDILKFPQGLDYSGIKLRKEVNSFFVVDFFTAEPGELDRFPLPLVHTVSHYPAIEHAFQELLKAWKNGNILNRLQSKAMLYKLLSKVLYHYISEQYPEQDLSKIVRITEYINQHYGDADLNIPMLCSIFYLSESTLRRMFFSTCGMTPVQYITDVRMNAAKNMLIYDNIPVNAVAVRCGFASPYYFSRIFKQKTGLSPSEFRKQG